MKNTILLNCVCLSTITDSYSIIYYCNNFVHNSGGWIGTADTLVTTVEEWISCVWKEKQIYIKITEDKDEKDIPFTMRVYDHLLKCGIDVLLWEGESEGD